MSAVFFDELGIPEPETVEAGWNVIVGADEARIVEAVRSFTPPDAHPSLYGDGQAAGRCVALLK